MDARKLVNTITLTRIPLSLVFIVLFRANHTLLALALGVWGLVFLTDTLDGYLARKLGVASVHGRLWDSLGDKAFYIAVIISFNAHGILGSIVSWGLMLREVALYITRIWYIEKLDMLELIRPYTNWHGYFMYATIVLGFYNMFEFVGTGEYPLHIFTQITAYLALAFGVASIFKFLSLK